MKTILLSLVVASGLLMADVAENKEFCTQLETLSIVKVGLDTFAIRDGNASKCEDHTKEEWQDMVATSKHFGLLMGISTLTMDGNNQKSGTCSYEHYVKQIENREYSNEEMETFLEKVEKECQRDGFAQESKK